MKEVIKSVEVVDESDCYCNMCGDYILPQQGICLSVERGFEFYCLECFKEYMNTLHNNIEEEK